MHPTLGDSTLAEDIEQMAAEPLLSVAFVAWDQCTEPVHTGAGAVPWSEGRAVLAEFYDLDEWHGGPQVERHAPRFVAWSENWVVICSEYDCSWSLTRVARNPL